MLVLTRKVGQGAVVIVKPAENPTKMRVSLEEVRGRFTARVGIMADPKKVDIMRDEIAGQDANMYTTKPYNLSTDVDRDMLLRSEYQWDECINKGNFTKEQAQDLLNYMKNLLQFMEKSNGKQF